MPVAVGLLVTMAVFMVVDAYSIGSVVAFALMCLVVVTLVVDERLSRMSVADQGRGASAEGSGPDRKGR